MYHKKIFFCFVVAFVLIFVSYGTYKYIVREEYKVRNAICESVVFSNSDNSTFVVRPFEKRGEYYVILPAHWNLDSVSVSIHNTAPVKLNFCGSELSRSATPINISTDSAYVVKTTLPFGITLHTYRFIFRKSQINSIFINTESGNMREVDLSQDKSGKEKGIMLAVADNGAIEYQGQLSSIHGRGNMTWAMHKKTYSIKLKDKVSLFGLKKAKKFNLLANACDETSLRNWILLDTAERLQMPNAIRSAFTILYLNGHYRGLFQITNKVEIDKSSINIVNLEEKTETINKKAGKKLNKLERFSIDRNDTLGFIKGVDGAVNPSDISGGYLLDHNFKLHRYAESPSGFISSYGYPTEIKSPEFATREQVKYISNYYAEMMEAICDANGKNSNTGLHYSQYIDVDSYIYYYLCSEVFLNLDAVNASLYMYKDRGGKMYCGPVWDYDISMNTKVFWDKANGYNSFYIREAREKDGSLRIFGQLYNHSEYKKRLVEIYNQQFLPLVREYYQGNRLDSIHNYIAEDLKINDIMWNEEYSWLYDLFQNDCEFSDTAIAELEVINQKGDYWNIKNFLKNRCEFFASVWKDMDSESQFSKIIVDFGRIEQFQHTTTQVTYLIKNHEWIWPRYLISNKKETLLHIEDSDGVPIKEGQESSYYRMVYKDN